MCKNIDLVRKDILNKLMIFESYRKKAAVEVGTPAR